MLGATCICLIAIIVAADGRPFDSSSTSHVATMDEYDSTHVQYSEPEIGQENLEVLGSLDRDSELLLMKWLADKLLAKNGQEIEAYLHDREILVRDLVEAHRQLPKRYPRSLLVAVKCYTCQAAILLLKEIATTGVVSEDTIVNAMSFICELFRIESKSVCSTVIMEFKDEFFYTASHLTIPVKKACGIVLPECSATEDPFQNWNVTLPDTPKPPVKPPILPPGTAPKLRILTLSDIHLDFKYEVGSNAECGEPLCCRSDNGIAPDVTKAAGKWGDYRGCDLPYWTLENLLQHLNTTQKFDMIYWLGDLPSHHIWDQTREQQTYIYRNLTKLFLKYFPHTPVFSTLGNHESDPVDSFPPPYVTGNNSIAWLYNVLADSWTNWIPQETTSFIKKGAYYSVLIQPGFRVISMNMNYCNNHNWWMLLNDTDPAESLSYLVKILQYAEDHNERVHILGHIPPGCDACLKTWSWNYHKIINRYESTIAAQFFGHTHRDAVQLFFDERNHTRPVSVGYVAPSVTTFPDLNPGYRIVTVDGNRDNSTRLVLDHETYYMNLTDANLRGQPRWQLEYTAKAAYGLKSLLPSDWNQVINRMKTDDTLFNKYNRYYTKLSPKYGPCTGGCRTNLLCQAKTARSYDKTFC